MSDKGHIVSGSDRSFDKNPDNPLLRLFRKKRIRIFPQDGNGINNSLDLVVFSTAVEPDSPEFIKAKTINIPIKTRPEYLSEITSSFRTIAVSGTSGKSTSSGMLAFIMKMLGLSPNLIGGGRVKQFKTDLNPGNSIAGDSDLLIIEACESDGSIVNYRPLHTVILNLELDHHAISKTARMFGTLIENTSGKVLINSDDRNLGYMSLANEVGFSIDSPSRYKAEEVLLKPYGTDFSVSDIKFNISLPGKYNLYNALSCIALLSELGIPLRDICEPLKEFQGIERRFDIKLNDGKRLVIDDYAHNPHKISSLMQVIRTLRDSVCYIFQPHGFAPTRMMKNGYIETFSDNIRDKDHLIVLPIFYAGGTVQRDISSNDIVDGVRKKGKSSDVSERDDVLKMLHRWKNYVIFGARDDSLSDFAEEIAKRLKDY